MDLLLKFFYPPGLCLLLLLAALLLLLRKRSKASSICMCLAIGVLFLSGNGWVVRWSAYALESQYPPPNPVPQADCILVLGGGLRPKEPPRPSIELSDGSDRVFYAARLYREGKAPWILCAGGKPPGSTRDTSESEDERQLLCFLGIPDAAILTEHTSSNTYENVRKSHQLLRDKGVKRLLLVTSALHTPRAFGVARRQLPELDIIPAPTDFIVTEPKPKPLLKQFEGLLPTGQRLMQMESVLHEYLGIAYYKTRGWM